MSIKVYTSSNCPYCVMVKKFLKEKNVKFKEINIEKHPEAIEEIKKTGFVGVPVVDVNGTMIFGFDEEKIQEALK